MPKVLTCRKGKFPLANWTSVAKGQGHNSQNDRHYISSTHLISKKRPKCRKKLYGNGTNK